MKKLINILCVLSAVITSILIICTFATSYQFFYVNQVFNYYWPIQLGGAITMALLAIRFRLSGIVARRLVYSYISLFISIGLLISMTFVK